MTVTDNERITAFLHTFSHPNKGEVDRVKQERFQLDSRRTSSLPDGLYMTSKGAQN